MSDTQATNDNPVFDRIRQTVEQNDVLLFMKGSPQFPQCGFSATCPVDVGPVEVVADEHVCRRRVGHVEDELHEGHGPVALVVDAGGAGAPRLIASNASGSRCFMSLASCT